MSQHFFRKFKLNEILFVDLELTCEDNQGRFVCNGNERFREVIEIGVVKVDNVKGLIVDKETYLITNEREPITEFCTSLTGISQELIDKEGVNLGKASKQIVQRFGSLNKTWFAWGCGDYNAMVKNCERKNYRNPFSCNYVNYSELYALMNGWTRSRSLKKVALANEISFNGQQHRALVDAEATAEIYLKTVRG